MIKITLGNKNVINDNFHRLGIKDWEVYVLGELNDVAFLYYEYTLIKVTSNLLD